MKLFANMVFILGTDEGTTARKRSWNVGGLLPTNKPSERKMARWVNNPIEL